MKTALRRSLGAGLVALVAVLALLVTSLGLLAPGRADAQETKQVFVLHSYNRGLTWTDSEDAGIRSALETRVADVEIHTEYLDTKLVSDHSHYPAFVSLMQQKYASTRFDVVIATDDDAYNFCLAYRDVLFPGVPIVFCGVNYFQPAQPEVKAGTVTGVVEGFDVARTLRIAFRLHPEATRVVVINDTTTTGRANKKTITEKVVPLFARRADFVFFEDLTMEELLAKVSAVSPDDIILLMTFNQDRAGQVFSYDQSIALIARKARAPIYGVWDFYLGKGIVGGALVNGFDQGRTAGRIALRILDGESAADIPIIRRSPIKNEFDYKQLTRFGIAQSEVPSGSVIINRPASFYALHKGLVWSAALGFIGLLVTIAFLLVYIRQRRRGEQALRRSEEQYRTLVNNLNVAVARTSPSGRYLQVNPAMATIFGYGSAERLMQAPVNEIYRDPAVRQSLFDELFETSALQNVEVPMQRRDGTPLLVSVNATVQRDEQGAIKWVDAVLEDITEQRRAEEELRERDREIRQAYTDVIHAATGGKLVLMTAEEIGNALGEQVLPPTQILPDSGLSENRHQLRAVLASLVPPPRVIDEFVLAAGEAMTNVLKHGVNGQFSVRRTQKCAQVVITDAGPGIEFRSIPKVTLIPGFSTKTSLGMGFTIMLEVADRILLSTMPSRTIVVLEVEFAE